MFLFRYHGLREIDTKEGRNIKEIHQDSITKYRCDRAEETKRV